MTDDEKFTEIGRMMVERKELRLRLVCVENKAKRLGAALARFSEALAGSAVWHVYPDTKRLKVTVGAHSVSDEHAYPSEAEVAEVLEARKALMAQLAELDARLKDVC